MGSSETPSSPFFAFNITTNGCSEARQLPMICFYRALRKKIGWMDYNLKILFPRFSALLRRIHGFVQPSAYPPPEWGNSPHRRVFITLTSCTTWFEYCTTPLHRWRRVCALPRVAAGPETAVHEGAAECGRRQKSADGASGQGVYLSAVD